MTVAAEFSPAYSAAFGAEKTHEFSAAFSPSFAAVAGQRSTTYASVDDVAARLGRPITDPAEVAQVQAWLNDIELIIRSAIPNLDELVAAGVIDAQAVAMVEANAVVRMVRNPDGKVQEGVDDYSYRLSENARGGYLYLTDDEWALILPAGAHGAWTITPGRRPYGCRGEWVRPDLWVPLP